MKENKVLKRTICILLVMMLALVFSVPLGVMADSSEGDNPIETPPISIDDPDPVVVKATPTAKAQTKVYKGHYVKLVSNTTGVKYTITKGKTLAKITASGKVKYIKANKTGTITVLATAAENSKYKALKKSFKVKIYNSAVLKKKYIKVSKARYKKGKPAIPVIKYKKTRLINGKNCRITYKNNKKRGIGKATINANYHCVPYRGKLTVKFVVK